MEVALTQSAPREANFDMFDLDMPGTDNAENQPAPSGAVYNITLPQSGPVMSTSVESLGPQPVYHMLANATFNNCTLNFKTN